MRWQRESSARLWDILIHLHALIDCGGVASGGRGRATKSKTVLEGEARAALAWQQWAGLRGRPILSKSKKLSDNEHSQPKHTHFHPSGDPQPSPEDIAVTEQLVQAGQVLDIELLDHLIIGNPGYVSLRERLHW